MPVLPEVGSTSTERSGAISPSASARSTMARPMRSLTEPSGLKNSSFSATSATSLSSAVMRGMPTSGVAPIVSRMLRCMRPLAGVGAGVGAGGRVGEGGAGGGAARGTFLAISAVFTTGPLYYEGWA